LFIVIMIDLFCCILVYFVVSFLCCCIVVFIYFCCCCIVVLFVACSVVVWLLRSVAMEWSLYWFVVGYDLLFCVVDCFNDLICVVSSFVDMCSCCRLLVVSIRLLVVSIICFWWYVLWMIVSIICCNLNYCYDYYRKSNE
jgi:hypothetical protein